MKGLLPIGATFLLALGILMGCDCTADQAADNKALVLAANDALMNMQIDVLDQYFAADFKRHCQATPEVRINSLNEMITFVQEWSTAFPDMKMELRKVVAEDDLVALWGTFTGTHQAPLGEIPATGKQMVSETFAIFRVADGKIAESWVTWDNLAILKQLGLFPEPTAADETEPEP